MSQRVRLDIKLLLDLSRAGKSGRIAHTIDYSRASTEIIALMMFRRYSLLEVAAEECAGWLFAAYPSVQTVELSVEKPQALAGQADASCVHVARERPREAAREPRDFGFEQPQLETSDACISLVGLDPGRELTLQALGAESALILPLSAGLRGPRPLHTHQPARLEADEACENADASAGLLVVCAKRGSAP